MKFKITIKLTFSILILICSVVAFAQPKRKLVTYGTTDKSSKLISKVHNKAFEFDHIPNELIIKIKPQYLNLCGLNEIGIKEVKEALSSAGKYKLMAKHAEENKRFFPQEFHKNKEIQPLEGIYHVVVGPSTDLAELVNILQQLDCIAYAEPIRVQKPLYVPNDRWADSLLNDSVLTGKINYLGGIYNQYHLAAIKAYQAWNITKGDTNVLIGVVDVAFDTTQEDLRQNIKYNYADPIDGIDNDGNGYTDDYWGWNVANTSGDIHSAPAGNTVHGSQVGGIIGAKADNGVDYAGVGFNCKIVPVKCWNGFGLQNTYEGIRYCVKRGCKVINCSWGTPGTYLQYEQDIINDAVSKGAIIIAAGGNGTGQFYNETPFYPATYSNVLAVAQCLPNGASFLSGPVNAVTYNNYIDLIAPGINIYSVLSGDHGETGSSMAAPIVAGAAGLVWARFPHFTPQQIMEQIRVSTDYKDSMSTNIASKEKMGSGMLNVYRAVSDTTLRSVRMVKDSIFNTFLNQPEMVFAGDTLYLGLKLTNFLKPTTQLRISISTSSPYLTVLDSVWQVGSMGTLSSSWNTSRPLKILVSSTSPGSFSANFRMGISDGTYKDYQYFTLNNINPPKVYPTSYDMDINNVRVTFANTGRFAFNDTDANAFPSQGSGYKYVSPYHRLWEGGILLSTNTAQVSDCIRGAQNTSNQQLKDNDFRIVEHLMSLAKPSSKRIYSTLSDSNAINPMGLRIKQNAIGYPNDAFIYMEYEVQNTTNRTLDSLQAGLFFDWVYYSNVLFRALWDSTSNTQVVSANLIPYLSGIQVVYPTNNPANSFFNYNTPANGITIADGFTEQEKYSFMSRGILNKSAGLTGSGVYIASYVGAKAFAIQPGESRKFVFALMNGSSYSDLMSVSAAAKAKYVGQHRAAIPVMDTLITICQKNKAVLVPSGGMKFNFYDTIPGIRPPLASNVQQFTTPTLVASKTYYITNADSIFESLPLKVKIQVNTIGSSFISSISTATPQTLMLSATTSSTSSLWSLGDGSTGAGVSITKTYAQGGNYLVSLISTSNQGCKDTVNQQLNVPVYIPAPKPVIDTLILVCKGSSAVLSPSGGTKFNFYTLLPGTGAPIATATGTFTTSSITGALTYYITSADSLFEGPYTKVVVDFSKSKADFTFALSPVTPLSVDFNTSISGINTIWSLGDGNTASGNNFVHTYGSPGTFPVKLTTIDNIGCKDSVAKPVSVNIVTQLDNASLSSFGVAPNPVSDKCTIKVHPNVVVKDIKLVTLQGKSLPIPSLRFISKECEMDVNEIPTGLYQLIVETDHGQWLTKISVVH